MCIYSGRHMYIRYFTSYTHVFLGDLFPIKMLDVPKQLIPRVTICPSLSGIEEVPGTWDYNMGLSVLKPGKHR